MLEIVIDEAAREDVAASLDETVPHIPRCPHGPDRRSWTVSLGSLMRWPLNGRGRPDLVRRRSAFRPRYFHLGCYLEHPRG